MDLNIRIWGTKLLIILENQGGKTKTKIGNLVGPEQSSISIVSKKQKYDGEILMNP